MSTTSWLLNGLGGSEDVRSVERETVPGWTTRYWSSALMKGPVTTWVTAASTSPAVGARSVLQLEPQKIGQMWTGERTGPWLSAKRIPERVVASDPPEDARRAAAPSAT